MANRVQSNANKKAVRDFFDGEPVTNQPDGSFETGVIRTVINAAGIVNIPSDVAMATILYFMPDEVEEIHGDKGKSHTPRRWKKRVAPINVETAADLSESSGPPDSVRESTASSIAQEEPPEAIAS